MLTPRELAQLRSDVLETLPDTCRIERPTETRSAGYASNAWGTAVASTPCRLDPNVVMRGNTGAVASREAMISGFILTLGWNVDIQPGDRIAFGSQYYQVVELYDNHSDRITRRVFADVIRGG